jgi:hypothetical protein
MRVMAEELLEHESLDAADIKALLVRTNARI